MPGGPRVGCCEPPAAPPPEPGGCFPAVTARKREPVGVGDVPGWLWQPPPPPLPEAHPPPWEGSSITHVPILKFEASRPWKWDQTAVRSRNEAKQTAHPRVLRARRSEAQTVGDTGGFYSHAPTHPPRAHGTTYLPPSPPRSPAAEGCPCCAAEPGPTAGGRRGSPPGSGGVPTGQWGSPPDEGSPPDKGFPPDKGVSVGRGSPPGRGSRRAGRPHRAKGGPHRAKGDPAGQKGVPSGQGVPNGPRSQRQPRRPVSPSRTDITQRGLKAPRRGRRWGDTHRGWGGSRVGVGRGVDGGDRAGVSRGTDAGGCQVTGGRAGSS